MSFKKLIKEIIISLKRVLNKLPVLKKILKSILKIFPSFYKRIERIKPTTKFDSYCVKKVYNDIKNTLEDN